MMKKTMWMGVMVLMASAAVMAIAVPVTETEQCWTFTDQPYDNSYAVADEGYFNPFGKPKVTVSDMSVQQDMIWDQRGFMTGSGIKLYFDIPNLPITEGRYKELTLRMKFQGQIDFLYVADWPTGIKFQQITENPITLVDGWQVYEQDFRFDLYNPIEEFVMIGLKSSQDVTGATIMAAVDQVCIVTECIPEPATLALLAIGSLCVMKRKRV
jgi:hypothetical protein